MISHVLSQVYSEFPFVKTNYEDGWIAGEAVKVHFRNRQHYTNRTKN